MLYEHRLLKEQAEIFFSRFWEGGKYVLGEEVEGFEKKWAAFCNTRFAVGTGSGLDALYIALKVAGIGAGDEVIVPSNTYIATVLAVMNVGATPVFAEPDPHTYNLNLAGIKPEYSAKTKAIIPVHLYGLCADMDGIMHWANENNLLVIEDFAQAHGARIGTRRAGSFGHINAGSFYPTKNLGAVGEAGIINTNHEEYARQAILYRNYGSQTKYVNRSIGINSRLDALQAGILSLKLGHLEEWNQIRILLADTYTRLLAPHESIIPPFTPDGFTHVYHRYIIRTDRRNELAKYLHEKGVGTDVHYPIPPFLQESLIGLGYAPGSFPIAEELAGTMLSLPLYPGLTVPEVEYVCGCINSFLRG